ncbi:MAG: O-methyltransferase [Clostridia bacterium]|nr:O-methyltransferase [Clostridia bacterium]
MIEYEKDAIVHPYVTRYIRGELFERDEFLRSLESYAEENNIPIVPRETASLLSVLSHMMKPVNVLEIGCAIGYSSILISRGLSLGGQITTVEYSPEMAAAARENIKRAGLSDTIAVVEADAKDYIKELNGVYDFIFLDGPKAHYVYMLDDCVRLLRKGGILVSDNVLYKGMTADDRLVIRRKITIVRRLRKFISALVKREDLKTSIIPIGDGVTVSVKL